MIVLRIGVKVKKFIFQKIMYALIVVRMMKHIKYFIIINAFQIVQLILIYLL